MLNKKTNISVKKILKKKGKIIHIDEIKKILADQEQKAIYKKIYHLKNQGYLISLKKDLFFVKSPEEQISLEEIIDKNYWQILKKYLTNNFGQKYFIGGVKALEIWNNNFDIPDKIIIVNPFKKSNITLVKEKTVANVIYTIKGLSPEESFKKFKKQTEKILINNNSFIVANYEFSLLESMHHLPFFDEKYIYEIVKKNIRKNHKRINLEIFEYFLKLGKYGQSLKRIYELSLTINPIFAEKLKKLLMKWYRL